MYRTFVSSCCLLIFAAVSVHGQTVSLESLLEEMTDRESVARFPQKPPRAWHTARRRQRPSKGCDDWFSKMQT